MALPARSFGKDAHRALGAAQVPCDYRVRTADDNRFWRKTLRDNNANGIYGDNQDGVDPNRNHTSHWGMDNEGSSDDPLSETYRGTAAESTPEVKAMANFVRSRNIGLRSNRDGPNAELVTAYRRLPHRQLMVLGGAGAGKSVFGMLLTLGLLAISTTGLLTTTLSNNFALNSVI